MNSKVTPPRRSCYIYPLSQYFFTRQDIKVIKSNQKFPQNPPFRIPYFAMSALVDIWSSELSKQRKKSSTEVEEEAKSKTESISSSQKLNSWVRVMKFKLPKMDEASVSMLVQSFSP
ncbi:hypothetical protein LIER_02401 [Lithospermum erythrorhizon]|uniref:Uncharacterized protein n=1 Tax=Lithospermum erythrorhizon TaxID=34254 RepID=A0AAV3NQE9_LITER